MGLNHSPRVATNGLAMYLDTDNLKSYKGPPVQNILTHLTASTFNATGIVFTPGTESVNVPEVGTMTVKTVTGYNDYPALSTACCPSLYSYYSSFLNVSPSTLYTYAILYKVDSGYTHPNFMYRYEYTSANAYVTEAGVHSNTNRIHLGNGWYWAWGTFTTQATTAKITTFSFYYQTRTSANPDKMSVAKVLLVQGDYTKLHPKYWVDVNTTRANTQAISDLVSSQTITASALTYSNTGSFSFNGSNNYVRVPDATNIDFSVGSFSISFFAYHSTLTGFQTFFQIGGGSYSNGANLAAGVSIGKSGSSLEGVRAQITDGSTLKRIAVEGIIPVTQWYNLTYVVDRTNNISTLYKNGVSIGSLDITGFGTSTTTKVVDIGYDTPASFGPLNGSLSNAQLYNKALTAQEVRQNFNALRGRYGI